VPHVRLDDGRLTLAEDARLPVALHGQLAVEHGEPLDDRRVAVLTNDARPDEGGELGDDAALGIRERSSRIVARSPVTGSSRPRQSESA